MTTRNKICIYHEICSGNSGRVASARFNHDVCAAKEFDDVGDYYRELTAYQELEKAPELKGRVPRLYGNEVELAKPTIFMEYVQGATLRDVLPSLGDDQREKVRAIVEDTLRILHRAGISHGDVTATNVVVDSRGEKATLVDFGAARREAFELLDRSGAEAEQEQERLLALLKQMAYADGALLSAILAVVATPSSPDLALELAKHLALCHRSEEAVPLLLRHLQTTMTTEPTTLLRLRTSAAQRAAEAERATSEPDNSLPKAHALYEEAIAIAGPGKARALRLELAHHQRCIVDPAAAVRTCMAILNGSDGAPNGREDAQVIASAAHLLQQLLPRVYAEEQLLRDGKAAVEKWKTGKRAA
ncbi:hypothetical protein B0J12DRAFT_745860 [Macrophomina phaseolina]|uniref:EKC/KEOPS complex subunit BUD32 n=1 Tax=Macrophomina phaseolina TaxID=35725 RepID=A0ABQ8FU72_9PEZI|nr:hypothetical protein B0J12DRAFT_745860 [Macrophomina phaseolina]